MADPVRVFLSYSDKDREIARRFAHDLHRDGLDVWFAEEDLRAGRPLDEAVDEQLQQCNTLIVLLSDASIASQWVRAEISKFLLLNIEGDRVIVPVSIRPFPLVKIPVRLAGLKRVSFIDRPWDAAMREVHAALGLKVSAANAVASSRTETPAPPERTYLLAQLQALLRALPEGPGLLMEVLAVVPGTLQLATVAKLPESASGLPTLLRPGQGLVGQVFQSRQPFVGAVDHRPGIETHLLRAQSALVLPLVHNGEVVGILNLESPASDTFDASSLGNLTSIGVIDRIATFLAQTRQLATEPVTSEEVVEALLATLESQILALVNPDDLPSAYHQILQLAVQLPELPGASGGILLVRDESSYAPVARDNAVPTGWIGVTARIGDYDPDPAEWPLGAVSVAGRAIKTQTAQLVARIAEDPDYRSAGSQFHDGAELVLPLVDNGTAIGVIDVVSPTPNAFSFQDLTHLQRLAAYAVQAVKRLESIADAQRAQLQLQCAGEIQRIITSVFSPQGEIGAIRGAVLDQILDWGLHYTESRVGTVLSLESMEGQAPELVVTRTRVHGGTYERAPNLSRFGADRGLIGTAFTTKRSIVVSEATEEANYVNMVPGIRSELAVPLQWGGETVGVLDLESERAYHYTTIHVHWAEFLAAQVTQAMATIDAAMNTRRDLALAHLSADIDRVLQQEVGQADLSALRDMRNQRLRDLVGSALELTEAHYGAILLLEEAIQPGGSLDHVQGCLVVVATATTHGQVSGETRSLGIQSSLPGRVVQTREYMAFNDVGARPVDFISYLAAPDDIRSDVVIPIVVGGAILGVLDLQSRESGAFTPADIMAGRKVGDLAARILEAVRERTQILQEGLLRTFQYELLRTQEPGYEAYLSTVLLSVAGISGLNDGWGQVTLLAGDVWEDDAVRSDYTCVLHYEQNQTKIDTYPTSTNAQYAAASVALHDPTLQGMLRTQRPVLLLDAQASPPTMQGALLMPGARSVLCVPLLWPTMTGDVLVRGFLALGHPMPYMFGGLERDALADLAASAVLGLRNVGLLQARIELLQSFRHEMSRAMVPLIQQSTDLLDMLTRLRDSLEAENWGDLRAQIAEAGSEVDAVNRLTGLTADMTTWYLDLAQASDGLPMPPSSPLDVAVIRERMQRSISTLAQVVPNGSVTWQNPTHPLYIQGNDIRERLICAVLFKFIENGLWFGQPSEVTVSVWAQSPLVIFRVFSRGQLIPVDEREYIFDADYRMSTPRSSASELERGLGLYQVRRIAEFLGGQCAYRAIDLDGDSFELGVPMAQLGMQ